MTFLSDLLHILTRVSPYSPLSTYQIFSKWVERFKSSDRKCEGGYDGRDTFSLYNYISQNRPKMTPRKYKLESKNAPIDLKFGHNM